MSSVGAPGLTELAADRDTPARSHAVLLLQLFALAVMVIPSDTVFKAIGAEGYPAALIGMSIFAVWLVAILFGIHDFRRHRHPIRGVLSLIWLCSLASYMLMDRGAMTAVQLTSADRFLMQLAVMTGVALVAAECLTSLSDVRRVLRALTWGGAFCGAVAGLQFWMNVDITPYLRALPGFTVNHDNLAIISRNALNRVAGTGIHPIELGVTAGMLLPIAVYLAIYDTDRTLRRRWFPVLLIAVAIPASVSRSAIIAVALSITLLIVLMPARQRLVAIAASPLAIVAVFMTAHGLIGTLASFFGAGTNDPSVANRVNNYPMVQKLVEQKPWFGSGGGTYIAPDAVHILDNQYLHTAIELGILGALALCIYFVVPLVVALVTRARTSDPELRLLCAALAGAAAVATVCSATFDSLSFPLFTNVDALVVGLIGTCWRLSATGSQTKRGQGVRPRLTTSPSGFPPPALLHKGG